MSLTLQDLRAIRHADHLVFRHNTPSVRGGDRQDWLECGLDVADSTARYKPL